MVVTWEGKRRSEEEEEEKKDKVSNQIESTFFSIFSSPSLSSSFFSLLPLPPLLPLREKKQDFCVPEGVVVTPALVVVVTGTVVVA